jgi:serine/threonine protein kinase
MLGGPQVYEHIMALPNEPELGRPRGILKPLNMTMKWGYWRVRMPLGTWDRPRTEKALKCLVADVLHGLAAFHEAGFVHRDVRAPNILQVTPKCVPEQPYPF